jgi:hypothetical protein
LRSDCLESVARVFANRFITVRKRWHNGRHGESGLVAVVGECQKSHASHEGVRVVNCVRKYWDHKLRLKFKTAQRFESGRCYLPVLETKCEGRDDGNRISAKSLRGDYSVNASDCVFVGHNGKQRWETERADATKYVHRPMRRAPRSGGAGDPDEFGNRWRGVGTKDFKSVYSRAGAEAELVWGRQPATNGTEPIYERKPECKIGDPLVAFGRLPFVRDPSQEEWNRVSANLLDGALRLCRWRGRPW